MALVKMVAEGIGPFEKLELDFSDGKGKPHLGPHILAGVNGSGKSTILRAIGWVLAEDGMGFPLDEFRHLLSRDADSHVILIPSSGEPLSRDGRQVRPFGVVPHRYPRSGVSPVACGLGSDVAFLPDPGIGMPAPEPFKNSLAFGSTIDNQAVQSWLLSLDYRRLRARDLKEEADPYQGKLDRLEDALRLICGKEVHLDPDFSQSIVQPRLRVDGKSLNFSQLSAGVRHTFGWVADFMRRLDQAGPDADPSLLLLDEVDAHLHPQWQRLLLPAMRKAFPDTQLIVSSHSPFVISSCKEAVVHMLKVDDEGRATLDHRQNAPFGSSVLATLGDIFGVESRFDIETEKDLESILFT